MGRKIALVIGNSEYDDASLARLITPSEDVTDLATLLKSPDIGGFDEVLTLVNEAATTVRKAVARLFKEKSPDDLLLLYFSGHGVLDDQGHLYLAVKDTERELLSGTAIPANFITGEMDRSRSKRQVLVFDCCHSGAFARGSKGAVGASVGTAAVFEGTGYGRVVLTATDATQYAWEGDRVIGQADNSVFTHFMIQGLRTGEADQDHDGRITLDELYDYVYAQVVATTPKQTPGKWSYKQQGEMVIAKNPYGIPVPVELPRDLQQALSSPLAEIRTGAVKALVKYLRGPQSDLAPLALAALERLTKDDSRSVASSARRILRDYTAQKAEAERVARDAERAEQERPAREAERIAREQAEQERLEKDQLEAERIAQEQAEAQRLARENAEQERSAKEQAETARLAAFKAEAERLAALKTGQAAALSQAQAALGESRWADAVNLLTQLRTEAPDYEAQTVESLLAQASEAVQREQHLMELYQQAEAYLHQEKWTQAIGILELISAINPNYKDIQNLTVVTQREIARAKTEQEQMAEPKAAAATQVNAGAVAPPSVVLLRALIVTGGWIAGWASGLFFASITTSNLAAFLSLIASWSIAALITGLILRRFIPSLQLYHIVILIIVWAFVPLAGLITQGLERFDFLTKLNLIASIAVIWLMNSWFVLQMPPISMWWQALAVGAAGAIGWAVGGTDYWYLVAFRLARLGWSPAIVKDSGTTTVGLLSNVILSGLIGGGMLAVMYWLTRQRPASVSAAIERAEAERQAEAERLVVEPSPSLVPHIGPGVPVQPRQKLSILGILGLTALFDIVYWVVAIGAALATGADSWRDILPVILGALAVMALMVVINFRIKALKGSHMWIVFLGWLVAGFIVYPLGFGSSSGDAVLPVMMGITGIAGFVVMYTVISLKLSEG